jgi:hypothetical protein
MLASAAAERGDTPNRKWLTDAQMLALIVAIHTEPQGPYGIRAWKDSSREGHWCDHKRRYKVTTDSRK